ncbi:MAG: RluA family pseudouridine synthase, partial [Deltaproteobacteria bacterium]
NTEPTLVYLARAYLPRAPDGEFQPSPAHRLDRETSGVVLVAKSRKAMVRLTEIFTLGLAKKRYVALAKGRFSRPEGSIDIPLSEHEQTKASREKRGVNLQAALTHYRTLAAGKQVSLVECRIETGRTHQIRRHLAAIGHPVVGDKRHGDFAFNRELRAQAGLRRMFLHAASLAFPLPGSGRELKLRSPLPAELTEPLARLGVLLPSQLHQPDER